MTPAQLQTLKAAIAANTAAIPAGQPWSFTYAGVQVKNVITGNNFDQAMCVAGWYSQIASPAFYVWRTNVSRSEIYNLTSPESTTWDWSKYKAQSVPEQNSWTQMFMGDLADFSQANLRAGISNIFTSASAVNATHAFAIGKRQANYFEKLFATGTGSQAVPAVMALEGDVTMDQILQATQS